jgi:hypothetical protein
MSTTFVQVNTYTHSVAFVTDKMLASFKRIIMWSGLDPSKLVSDWVTLETGVRTWLQTKHLVRVILEVFNPESNDFVGRWDFDISYSFESNDDGAFWLDTDAIKNAIKKCGLVPSKCSYRIVATTKPGSPDIRGWEPTSLRSTDGFMRYCIGTTIGANQLASGVAYWRPKQ